MADTVIPAIEEVVTSAGGTVEQEPDTVLEALALLNATISGGGGGSGTAIDLGITGASVGEFAVVASVDSNGKPTSWSAAQLPVYDGGTS